MSVHTEALQLQEAMDGATEALFDELTEQIGAATSSAELTMAIRRADQFRRWVWWTMQWDAEVGAVVVVVGVA